MANDLYVNMGLHPTRDGSTHIFFTWNSSLFDDDATFELYSVELRFYTSDEEDPVYVEDVTSEAGDGDFYETRWFGAGYHVQFRIHYGVITQDDTRRLLLKCAHNKTTFSNLITSSAPELSYNNGQLTISKLTQGRRIIEFHRIDRHYGYPSSINDEETLNEFLYTTALRMEGRDNDYQGYYYLNEHTLYLWRKGTHSVGVTFQSDTNKSRISAAIDNALLSINNVLSDYGVTFNRNGKEVGEITITVGPQSSLLPNSYAAGASSFTSYNNSDHTLASASVKLANDIYEIMPFCTYESCAMEEIQQCMGCNHDQLEYPYETIHSNFPYLNRLSSMYKKDEDILRLLYSGYVSAGDDAVALSRKLNIPLGCYMPTTSESDVALTVPVLSFLEANAEYEVRAFIVNSSGEVSATSDWMTITTPNGATPYVYSNGAWKSATPYVYSDGVWKPATVYIYNQGWKP